MTKIAQKNEWYQLNSSKNPQQIKELKPFENDLNELVRKITFK